jgi:HlyD family secretion protein
MSSINLDLKQDIDSATLTPLVPSGVGVRDQFRINKWLIGSLVAISLVGTIGYITYNQLVTVPQQRAQRKIQTAAVTRDNLTIVVSANGTVQPESSVNVSPKTSGVLKRLLVKEGGFVRAGQIVAYMDNSNLQGQLLQARGDLAAAEANLHKVMAGSRSQDIAQAQANLSRSQRVEKRVEPNILRHSGVELGKIDFLGKP